MIFREPIEVERGFGDSREPSNRLAAPEDIDRIPRLHPVDELAQMGFDVREIDCIHVTLMTI